MRKVVAVGDSFALENQLSMVDQAHQVGKSSVMLAVELKRFQATIPDRPFVNMLFSIQRRVRSSPVHAEYPFFSVRATVRDCAYVPIGDDS
jgi:hypothetical protein